ncbi:terminase large subunit [Pseudomonas phage phCDa]|uniref:Terminase large subunit n=1 Tax=Pseudomonas phage phCDa TaxID=2268587 RepID=A0A2Z5H8Y8_9CAUD|nr:terminase large subunit [Pseudomonas phage phCDa]AXC36463.1 terminase large subunit [Pseudomonas phage phCDa]
MTTIVEVPVDEVQRSVDGWLDSVDYSDDPMYVPSQFAFEFVNFIKMVNGGQGEENITPVLHLKMLDNIDDLEYNEKGELNKFPRLANMVFRGAAKTTLMGEYLFLYIGMYGGLPNFGRIELALYVSDSMENGVKNMRKNLEFRYEESEFLQKYMPKKSPECPNGTEFTDMRWKFRNLDGNIFIVKGYGAKTGVRGSKEMGKRPRLAVLDDLLSDDDARSPTVIAAVEDTIYKAVDHALHPERNMIIWSGTPFNAKDPLYKAVESGAWRVNVYPVCNQFPCAEEDFVGAWPDRFTYSFVKKKYDTAMKVGKVDTFNQELMLRIMSEEDRLIQDGEIGWYRHKNVMEFKSHFNFYITTDFATSEKQAADFSVISVWAYNYNGDWYWVDGICKRQDMSANISDLFSLVSKWRPLGVGVEVSGQQSGFIPWIQDQMMQKNVYFNLTSEGNSNKPGIRPNTNKMVRFNTVIPLFKLYKIYFPIEMKTGAIMMEMVNELSLASSSGFRSKKDDFIDTISMLSVMKPIAPTAQEVESRTGGGMWDDDIVAVSSPLSNYLA